VIRARDPHTVLGVSPDADAATVKRAFRALVREHHPDRSRDPGAEARFRELVDAYERLAPPRRRRPERLDASGIVAFYAWLAGRQPPPEPPTGDPPEPDADPPAPAPRGLGSRAARIAAAAGLLYALALLVLLLAR
jgi:curved DNA-binding protein CbpA